jgi:hypothetical protein
MLAENPLVETLPTTILEAKYAKLKHYVRYGNRIMCKIKEYYELLLRFGYLGKWSPCAYESLSTKGEDFYPHTLLYDSNFTLT